MPLAEFSSLGIEVRFIVFRQKRLTDARISSADLTHLYGFGLSLCTSMKAVMSGRNRGIHSAPVREFPCVVQHRSHCWAAGQVPDAPDRQAQSSGIVS